jgi:hypothetical protein
MCHLMFGVLCITAVQLMRLIRPYVALATNVDTGCILANVRVMFFLSA